MTDAGLALLDLREDHGSMERAHFDVYVRTRCGRVKLFVDGIGEESRSHWHDPARLA